MIVLDASVAIELLRRSSVGRRFEVRLADDAPSLHAPHLLGVEVLQGMRRLAAVGAVTADRGAQAVRRLSELDLTLHPHERFLPRVWELRDNLTAYDAVYVALAEALDAPLLTLDARLANAPGHRAEVEML